MKKCHNRRDLVTLYKSKGLSSRRKSSNTRAFFCQGNHTPICHCIPPLPRPGVTIYSSCPLFYQAGVVACLDERFHPAPFGQKGVRRAASNYCQGCTIQANLVRVNQHRACPTLLRTHQKIARRQRTGSIRTWRSLLVVINEDGAVRESILAKEIITHQTQISGE